MEKKIINNQQSYQVDIFNNRYANFLIINQILLRTQRLSCRGSTDQFFVLIWSLDQPLTHYMYQSQYTTILNQHVLYVIPKTKSQPVKKEKKKKKSPLSWNLPYPLRRNLQKLGDSSIKRKQSIVQRASNSCLQI